MNNTLVVVSDLGGFKAFRLDNDAQYSSPRLELLEQFNNAGAHGRLVEQVTDLAGRFPRTTGTAGETGGMSDGERHNIELEQRKRHVRTLAHRLNSIMRDSEVKRCYFAASREINRALLDELDPQARGKIEKNLSADLTKVAKSELLGHF